ncbi:MAG TPA: ABC transporter permease [Acidimicrobiales bacterium]|jgi:ABC-2 type transport system permease protein|nr:ABC transporter permease [Acidimicrobiales bacterium]
MTTTTVTDAAGAGAAGVLARPSGFAADVATIARRALRSLLREPEFLGPALFFPLFFYVINIGSLQKVAEQVPGVDYKAFEVPVAIIFAVTGVSRASVLVLDVQRGYLDKLLVTPVRRTALLLGMMVADIVLVFFLSVLVVCMGFIVGVRFQTGPLGLLLFLAISSMWGMAFTGIPYTVALRTGNPAAVNSSFLLFFPFLFFTSAFVPRSAMTGWLGAIAGWNPVTYLLDGLRALISTGWDWGAIGGAAAAAAGISVVTFWMAFAALRSRVNGPD